MYQAKARGKGCYVIYDSKSPGSVAAQSGLTEELRQAINDQDIGLQYLPIYDLSKMRLVALEARPFWIHPSRGKLHQSSLNDIAEQANLQKELDLLTLKMLSDEYPQLARIYHMPKVQLSMCSLHGKQRQSMETLCHRLTQGQFPTERIWLFFHEKSLVQDTENHINMFDNLSKQGVKLGLYGYGTSYSSLSSLSFMPVSALRLDPSFAAHLDNAHHYKLAKASSLAASVLDLQVFATGIAESETHRSFIEMGVTYGQGPLLGSSIELVEHQESA